MAISHTLGVEWDNGYGYGSAVSGTFSPTDNALIVLLFTLTGDGSTSNTITSITNSGTARTWTKRTFQTSADGVTRTEIWTAPNATSQTNITITPTMAFGTGASYGDFHCRALVVTGHDAATPCNGGGSGNGATTTNNLTAGAGTTGAANARLYGVICDLNGVGEWSSSDATVTQMNGAVKGAVAYRDIAASGSAATMNLDATGSSAIGGSYATIEINAGAGGPATIAGTASLSATSTLTATGLVTKLPTASMTATASLTATAVPVKLPDVTLTTTATLDAVTLGDVPATATLSAYSTLYVTGAVYAADISNLIVGAASTYGIGSIILPGYDAYYFIDASDANCLQAGSPARTRSIRMRFPRPADQTVDHFITIRQKITNQIRRIVPDSATATQGDYQNGPGVPYASIRQDGWVVECAEAVGSEATITYRWDTVKRKWYYDTYSGNTLVLDHRPNEMPEGYAPLYFSPAARAAPDWLSGYSPGIAGLDAAYTGLGRRDATVLALTRGVPYWGHRFLADNGFIVDMLLTNGISDPGNESLMWRHTANGSAMGAGDGFSMAPWSTAIDLDAMLHELGHLFDFKGLPYAGHPLGYQPLAVNIDGGLLWPASDPGERLYYHDAPYAANVKHRITSYADGTAVWLQYATDGVTVVDGYGPISRSAPAVNNDLVPYQQFDQLPQRLGGSAPDGQYCNQNIGEWVAGCISQYFMVRAGMPGTAAAVTSTPTMDAWLYEVGIFPFLDAMVTTATLTATANITRTATATMSATSTLTATAQVVKVVEPVTLSATSTLTAEATVTHVESAAATLITTSTLTATATATAIGAAALITTATLTASTGAGALVTATASLTTTATLSATGSVGTPATVVGTAVLLAVSTLRARYVGQQSRAAPNFLAFFR